MDKKKTTVVIADDHPLFREGLKQIIEYENNFEIIGEAGDGEKALEMIKEKKPDIAILDMSMPGKTGLEVLKELNISNDPAKIIFLTMHKEEYLFNEAMDLGIKGYVLKERASEDISNCLELVANDDYAISPLISDYLVKRLKNNERDKNHEFTIEALTKSERTIIKLISDDMSSKDIADKLSISIKTVENHRTNISHKLNLTGALSLVKFALENKSIL